jgi:hypothetical protein
MLKSALGKVMWVGRATVFMVGLAVILAVVFGAATTALAHSGVDTKLFHLGHSNSATTPTSLVSTLADAAQSALIVNNRSGGAALELRVGNATTPANDVAPMKVNSNKVVTNLNADKVDGRESSSFANVAHAHAGEEITSGTVAEPRIDAALARDAEVMNTVRANDGPGSGLDADTVDGKHAADFGISTGDDSQPAHECDTPSTRNQCAPVTFTNLDPGKAYIATVWSSFSAKAPTFSSREVSYCAGYTSDRFTPSCIQAENKVRVHDYFTAASTSAVSFRFGGQTSMTFYTAINPSAEFEVTNGDYVITTVMLRNAASPEA